MRGARPKCSSVSEFFTASRPAGRRPGPVSRRRSQSLVEQAIALAKRTHKAVSPSSTASRAIQKRTRASISKPRSRLRESWETATKRALCSACSGLLHSEAGEGVAGAQRARSGACRRARGRRPRPRGHGRRQSRAAPPRAWRVRRSATTPPRNRTRDPSRVGNRRLEGIVLGNLGPLWMFKGHPDASQECFEGALAIARELGNRRHQSFLHATLGILRHGQGRLFEARADYEGGARDRTRGRRSAQRRYRAEPPRPDIGRAGQAGGSAHLLRACARRCAARRLPAPGRRGPRWARRRSGERRKARRGSQRHRCAPARGCCARSMTAKS